MLTGLDVDALRPCDGQVHTVYVKDYRPAGQNRQVIVLVLVLDQNHPCWNESLFGIHTAAKMMVDLGQHVGTDAFGDEGFGHFFCFAL